MRTHAHSNFTTVYTYTHTYTHNRNASTYKNSCSSRQEMLSVPPSNFLSTHYSYTCQWLLNITIYDPLLGSFLWPQEHALCVPRTVKIAITLPHLEQPSTNDKQELSHPLVSKLGYYVSAPILCYLSKDSSENETLMHSQIHSILDSFSCLYLTSPLPYKLPNRFEFKSMSQRLLLG